MRWLVFNRPDPVFSAIRVRPQSPHQVLHNMAAVVMPDEPASNDRACSTDAPLAVNVNAEAGDELLVNMVKDDRHLLDGGNTEVWNFETTDVRSLVDGLVVVHQMVISAARTVLRQIDEVANSSAQQLLHNVNLIGGCARMRAGIGAGGKLARYYPVGAIRWARGHRPDRGLRSQPGQACRP